MLTGIAIMVHGPRYMPYGWVFVAVVIVLIAAVFIRVYGRGDRSDRQAGHRSRQTEHHDSHVPARGGSHGHQAASRRRRRRNRH
jgi:hypothetical protein